MNYFVISTSIEISYSFLMSIRSRYTVYGGEKMAETKKKPKIHLINLFFWVFYRPV